MISVLILTKNEAQDLPGCLASVAWSDDIHVLDSLSEDATVDIARAFGAKVSQRAFDDWSSHQNWALRHLGFRHPWVFYLDADERVSAELAEQLAAAVIEPGDAVAFRVLRRDFLRGTWLKHAQATPFYLRLFRPERVRYARLVNPTSIVDGPVGDVAGPLDHFPFSKGIAHWLARHNQYSTLEARQILANRRSGVRFSAWRAFTGGAQHERRLHQKELFYRLPARPLVKFLLLYIGKRGFLDGRAGLQYALLQSIYEYMIVLKTAELAAAPG